VSQGCRETDDGRRQAGARTLRPCETGRGRRSRPARAPHRPCSRVLVIVKTGVSTCLLCARPALTTDWTSARDCQTVELRCGGFFAWKGVRGEHILWLETRARRQLAARVRMLVAAGREAWPATEEATRAEGYTAKGRGARHPLIRRSGRRCTPTPPSGPDGPCCAPQPLTGCLAASAVPRLPRPTGDDWRPFRAGRSRRSRQRVALPTGCRTRVAQARWKLVRMVHGNPEPCVRRTGPHAAVAAMAGIVPAMVRRGRASGCLFPRRQGRAWRRARADSASGPGSRDVRGFRLAPRSTDQQARVGERRDRTLDRQSGLAQPGCALPSTVRAPFGDGEECGRV
jgi:hypothetical protein